MSSMSMLKNSTNKNTNPLLFDLPICIFHLI